MGRPRKYCTPAERRLAHATSQRAYRKRQAQAVVPLRRAAVERLLTAIEEAAQAGDPRAKSCLSENVETVLERLANLFGAHEPAAEAPEKPMRARSEDWEVLRRQSQELIQRSRELCQQVEQLRGSASNDRHTDAAKVVKRHLAGAPRGNGRPRSDALAAPL